MALIYKRLEIPSSNNFVRLCNDDPENDIIITDIIPPNNAINGYQLNILMGPNYTDDLQTNPSITNKHGISFNWHSRVSYKSVVVTGEASSSNTNVIYPIFSAGAISVENNIIKNLDILSCGVALFAYDPNNKLSIYEDPIHVPSYFNPNSNNAHKLIAESPKLLHFTYVTDYVPIRYVTRTFPDPSGWFPEQKGNFWILQNITYLYYSKPSNEGT